ncbi:MAG: CoA-binding protein [Desulfobacterales bacterium]
MEKSLHPFFNPDGIAVIGARSTPGFGYMLPANLKENGWGDRTFLVNPNGGRLHGMPVYTSVHDIYDLVDLAVVIVPAPAVPEVLTDIGESGIRHVILMSAGFAEAGKAGEHLQETARAVSLRYGLNVIGPNCVGVVNTANRFSTTELMPEAFQPGNLAVMAQSGVFGHNLLERFNEYGISISKAVTLGNRLVIDEIDVLSYFHRDPETSAIVMYIEGSAEGRRLKEHLKIVSQDKPVMILKSGKTEPGKAATSSHTGSLSGEDALYEGMFSQTGAIRAKTLQDLVDFARVFPTQPLPKGNRLGIITGSGSMGALATDYAVEQGLVLAPLSESIVTAVREGAPGWMNIKNPLDVGPSAQFPKAFAAMMEDPEIDMVLAIIAIPYAAYRHMASSVTLESFFFGSSTSLKHRRFDKPLAVAVISHKHLVDLFKDTLEPSIPVFTTPERAVYALAALRRYRQWRTGTADR